MNCSRCGEEILIGVERYYRVDKKSVCYDCYNESDEYFKESEKGVMYCSRCREEIIKGEERCYRVDGELICYGCYTERDESFKKSEKSISREY